MVPARNKTKCLSSVKYTTKIFHHYHHPTKRLLIVSLETNFDYFFQSLPSKSLYLEDEKCIRTKLSKAWLTGLAAAIVTLKNSQYS